MKQFEKNLMKNFELEFDRKTIKFNKKQIEIYFWWKNLNHAFDGKMIKSLITQFMELYENFSWN